MATPSTNEVAATRAPRYYQPQRDAMLGLTVEKIRLFDVPVIDFNTLDALDRGVIDLSQTPMPWNRGGEGGGGPLQGNAGLLKEAVFLPGRGPIMGLRALIVV